MELAHSHLAKLCRIYDSNPDSVDPESKCLIPLGVYRGEQNSSVRPVRIPVKSIFINRVMWWWEKILLWIVQHRFLRPALSKNSSDKVWIGLSRRQK